MGNKTSTKISRETLLDGHEAKSSLNAFGEAGNNLIMINNILLQYIANGVVDVGHTFFIVL